MVEIGVAIQVAGAAYNAIKGAVEKGRDAQDMIGAFGKFFDSMDAVSEANIKNQSASAFTKLFNNSSVEAQALEITAAKHKIAFMEKELREYLIYSGQNAFYEDMMEERRRIRRHRQILARKKAENKAMLTDILAAVTVVVLVSSIVGGLLAIFG
tara:strand:+ start:53 stop:517 length:465 start_codon:yes stop_codon:yes gene_type:complete